MLLEKIVVGGEGGHEFAVALRLDAEPNGAIRPSLKRPHASGMRGASE